MPNTCIVCRRTSRRFKDLAFIPFPSNIILREKWLNALNLNAEELSKSSRVCSMHFMDGSRQKTSVPSLSVGAKWGSVSARKKPKQRSLNAKSTKTKTSTVSSSTSSSHSTPQFANTPEPMGPAGDSRTEQVNSQKFKLVSSENYRNLVEKIKELEMKNAQLQTEISSLNSKDFSVHNFIGSDSDIQFHTGFPDSKTFMSVFELVGNPTQYFGYIKKCTDKCLGRQRKLDPLNEFFMYWVKMRQNIPDKTLGHMFGVSVSTVNAILTTWCILINTVFKQLPFYPTSEEFSSVCPPELKNKFPRCIAIYDCTEFYTETPSKLDIQRVFWSEYYHHHTCKALIGITLWGSVSFASKLYPGSISDPEIFKSSGAADLVQPGDQVMVDKGFLIDEQVVSRGGTIIRPPFKNPDKKPFNPQQVENAREIASVRIYVEQAIKRIKAFKYLQQLSISQLQLSSMHFQNIAFATNFQSSFVSATDPMKNQNKLQILYEKFCKAADSLEQNIEGSNDAKLADFNNYAADFLDEEPNVVDNLSSSLIAPVSTADTLSAVDDENSDVDLNVAIGLCHILELGGGFTDVEDTDFEEIEPTITL